MCELITSFLSIIGDSFSGVIGAAAGAIIADRIARNGERKRNFAIAQSQLFPALNDLLERADTETDMCLIRDESIKPIMSLIYQISPLLCPNEIENVKRSFFDFKKMELKSADQILGGMVVDILDSGSHWPHLTEERERLKEAIIQIKMSLTRH